MSDTDRRSFWHATRVRKGKTDFPRCSAGLLPGFRATLPSSPTGDNGQVLFLPDGWWFDDKTGSGDYTITNDIGLIGTTDGVQIVVAVLTRRPSRPHREPAPGDRSCRIGGQAASMNLCPFRSPYAHADLGRPFTR